MISGHVENALPRAARPQMTLHKAQRVSLEALLDGKPISRLLVVGTDRANSDLTSTGLKDAPRFQKASTMDPEALLDAAAAGVRSGAVGVLFARGGSNDGSEDLWDDPEFVGRLLALKVPFYTAIGHSDGVHLADRFADQSFTTPTHAGTELCRIVERRAVKAKIDSELVRLRERVATLERPGSQSPPRDIPLLQLRWPKELREWGIALSVLLVLLFLIIRTIR